MQTGSAGEAAGPERVAAGMRFKSYTVVLLGFGIGALAVSVVLALRMPDVSFVVLFAVMLLFFVVTSMGGIAFGRLMKKFFSASSSRYGTLLASWFALCVLWAAVVLVLLIVIEAPTLMFAALAVTACLMLVAGPPTLRRLKGPGR